MVKSYQRYVQDSVFGVITSESNVIHDSTSQIVYTSALDSIHVWNVKTQTLLKSFNDTPTPGSYSSTTSIPPPVVTRLAFSKFSNLIAAGYSNGDIKIWDISTESVLIKFQGHKNAISYLTFDSNGTNLVSGSNDTNIIIWDLVSEEGVVKLQGHRNIITGLLYLNENNYLLSTSKDGLIKIWDLKINQCIETHMAHSGESWQLAFEPNRSLIFTSGLDAECKVWKIDFEKKDGEKLTELGKFAKQSKNRSVDLNIFGNYLLIGNADKTAEIFRLRQATEIEKAINKRRKRYSDKGMEDEEINQIINESKISMLVAPFTVIYNNFKLRHATFSSCSINTLNVIINNANNEINYWTIELPENVKKHSIADKISSEKYIIDRPGHRFDIRSIDINQDDSLLYTGSNNQIKIWNLKTLNCIRSLEKMGHILSGKFLPGGSLLVVGLKNGDLKLINLSTSEILHHIENAHNDSIWSIELAPDGKSFLTGSSDKNVKFWEIKVDPIESTLKLNHVKTLELSENILSICISPDGKYLSVALMDNTVKIFFFDSLKFYLSLYGHKLPVLSIDISFDSKLIVTTSADKNIRIWGLDFGDCHRSIFAHDDSIMCIKFLPESHNFVTTSKDKFVKYWDGDKFEQVQKFAAHTAEVWTLAMSSTGEFFVTVGHDQSIRIWKEEADQVFIQEEREKEMDERYENDLLDSLEGDAPIKNKNGEEQDEDADDAAEVRKKTMENLKAGEKLMEALDMVDDPENAILKAMNTNAPQYVLDTLIKIKPAQLADSLLVMPFSYTLKLIQMITIWTRKEEMKKNSMRINIICRTLFFIIRSNHFELISQKDEGIKKEILRLKDQLRDELTQVTHNVGVNVQGLKFLQNKWKLEHSHIFNDNGQVAFGDDDEKSRKRVYTTLA
ncbi:snoRNA-binding rRNA-processing protein [Martiniozyma asiatica (nom. inval.)]|nr:snoRNA-binding rRNA-processing protein [Martiniozyma asiatica]